MAAERLPAPGLVELELAAEAERWAEAGFATEVAGGRRIATFTREAGLGVPVALITPRPPRKAG